MLDKIKSLGADTAVYGVSTIIGRFLNFLLVPFYTNVLSTSQYGIVATVYSYIAFMNIIYIYGMESAYFKYASTREIGSDKQIFSTPFFSILATSVVFSGLIFLTSGRLSSLIQVPNQFEDTIKYSAIILFLDSLSIIPFAALRLQRKVKTFATIKLVNITVNVIANVVLLLKYHAGVEGIFISGVIASAVTLALLLPEILSKLTLSFAGKLDKRTILRLYNALLKFGLPYIPAGLAAMMVQVIDRPILLALTNESTVGIYQANYRLGIFMMLVVSMYDYAWRPFFLTHANDLDAKQLFAKILTYFTFFSSTLILLVSLYIDDLVKFRVLGRFIINPAYWSGLGIVPIVLLGYLFNGIFVNLMAGIYIEKRTSHLPYITGIGAAVNVIANLLLIPRFGMFGAAWATFFAYAAMALAIYMVSQKYYPVQYELGRLLKIGIALGITITIFSVRHALLPSASDQLFKVLAFVSFFAILLLLRFPKEEELRILKRH
jgi:O-antigen/teichoic acid export membrane protein